MRRPICSWRGMWGPMKIWLWPSCIVRSGWENTTIGWMRWELPRRIDGRPSVLHGASYCYLWDAKGDLRWVFTRVAWRGCHSSVCGVQSWCGCKDGECGFGVCLLDGTYDGQPGFFLDYGNKTLETIALENTFFVPSEVESRRGIDAFLRGLINCIGQEVNLFVVLAMRTHLFTNIDPTKSWFWQAGQFWRILIQSRVDVHVQ